MNTLNPETLRRIRRLEIKTRRLVQEVFAGAYHSAFKGRGMAFDSVRPYEPGDDPRSIDWNVTARMDAPFIKTYTEDRELTVLLVLDSSASCFFGTQGAQKRDIAAELGAVLALTATSNNDKVGLLVFGETFEHYVPPRKGRNHVLRVIRDLLTVFPDDRAGDLARALRTANQVLHQRAIVFVLSDFLAAPSEYAQALAVTGKRHDVIAVVLHDTLESQWPDVGLVALHDAETDSPALIDSGRAAWREAFAQRAARFAQRRDATLTEARVDRVDIRTDGDIVRALTVFFHNRAGRR